MTTIDLKPDFQWRAANFTATAWPPTPSFYKLWRSTMDTPRRWHYRAYGPKGTETGDALSEAVAEVRAKRAMDRLR